MTTPATGWSDRVVRFPPGDDFPTRPDTCRSRGGGCRKCSSLCTWFAERRWGHLCPRKGEGRPAPPVHLTPAVLLPACSSCVGALPRAAARQLLSGCVRCLLVPPEGSRRAPASASGAARAARAASRAAPFCITPRGTARASGRGVLGASGVQKQRSHMRADPALVATRRLFPRGQPRAHGPAGAAGGAQPRTRAKWQLQPAPAPAAVACCVLTTVVNTPSHGSAAPRRRNGTQLAMDCDAGSRVPARCCAACVLRQPARSRPWLVTGAAHALGPCRRWLHLRCKCDVDDGG